MLFRSRVSLHLNPTGDLLAIGAAFTWATYSVILKSKIPTGKEPLRATKRIFFYGILTSLPIAYFMGFSVSIESFLKPKLLGNIIYLGVVASALGYLIWNWAVHVLGTLKTSVYIYVIPAITIVASAIFLKEQITFLIGLGAILAVSGLILSEKSKKNE